MAARAPGGESVKPAPFEYKRVTSIDQAVQELVAGEGSAKIIAGGQSLGPMLNLRLARPSVLIDIAGIAELKRIQDRGAKIFIGASTTHASIEDGILPATAIGLLQAVARRIAYRAVRNRGTIGGSLAHADPAADWILALTALNATVMVRGPAGSRTTPITSLLRAPFTTILAEDEIIVGVELDTLSPAAVWSHHKFSRKVGKFADAAAVTVLDRARGFCRVVLGSPDAPPAVMSSLADRLLSEPKRRLGFDTIFSAVEMAAVAADSFDRQLQTTVLMRAIEKMVVT
jgi:aerobic carbon-monoxide dehydrogenase medium subunit